MKYKKKETNYKKNPSPCLFFQFSIQIEKESIETRLLLFMIRFKYYFLFYSFAARLNRLNILNSMAKKIVATTRISTFDMVHILFESFSHFCG